MKPDIICYPTATLPLVSIAEDPSHSHTDMGCAVLFIEVKKSPQLDFLQDPICIGDTLTQFSFVLPMTSKTDLAAAEQALGQNIAYAAELCARQHRHACFSISFSGCFARLVRWDRAGAIATRAFDVTYEPELLCEFLWRFAYMSDAQRGYDLSVERGDAQDQTTFMTAIRTHVGVQLGIPDEAITDSHLFEHYKPGAVSVMRMFCDDGTEEELLVCRPLNSPLSVTGRATRAYWAVDRKTHQVVFLKDTWRYVLEGAEEEGMVIAALNQADVCNVPTLLKCGHVPTTAGLPWSRLTGPRFNRAGEYP